MSIEKRIDYIEIPVTDPAKARDFLAALYGWTFEEWGADYVREPLIYSLNGYITDRYSKLHGALGNASTNAR